MQLENPDGIPGSWLSLVVQHWLLWALGKQPLDGNLPLLFFQTQPLPSLSHTQSTFQMYIFKYTGIHHFSNNKKDA